MKTLFRVILILAAASLLAGLMYAAVNTAGNSSGAPTGTEIRQRPPQDGDFDGGPAGEFEEGGLFLPFGMLKALVVVSLIAVVYFQAINRFRQKAKPVTIQGG